MAHWTMAFRLAAALLVAQLLGCTAEQDGPLSFQLLATCLKVPQPTEQVFRTAEELRAFWAAYGGSGSEPRVDFGRFMVIAHFDGAGSACVGFTVESVTVKGEAVRVDATRHVSPDPCIAVVAYPQLVLAVERRDGPVAFRISDARDAVQGQTPACF